MEKDGMKKNLLFCIAAIMFFCADISAQDDNIHFTLAREFFAKENYDLAIDAYRKVLASFPDHYHSYSGLGDINVIQGNFTEAEANYKSALDFNPSWTYVQIKLADLYVTQDRNDEALKTYREALVGANEAQKNEIESKINILLQRRTAEEQAAAQTSPTTPTPATTPRQAAASSSSISITNAARLAMDSAVFYYQSGVRNSNRAHLERSLEFITRAIRETPGYPAAFYYAGLIRRRFNQNEMARINFERATGDPDLGYNAHFYLGKIYGEMRRYQQAIDNLEKYIEKTDFAQGKAEAHNLIETYRRLMRLEAEANPPIDIGAVVRAEIREELTALPPQVELREIEIRIGNNLTMAIVDTTTDEGQDLLAGVRLFNNKEYDRAIEAFRRFIEKYPDRPSAGSAVYNIAVCLFRLHNWDRANREFSNYMNRYPRGAMFENAKFLAAVALREQAKNNDAQRMFNDYIRRYRNGRWTGKAYEYLGDILSDLDQQNQAIEAYRQADALGTNNEDKLHARYKLAEIYRRLRNTAAAERAYLSVISLGEEANSNTRVPEAYYRLADLYYQNRRYSDAQNYYTKVTRLFPDDENTPWGLFQIANSLYHTNNYREAIVAYDLLRERFPGDHWATEAQFRRNDAVWRHQYKQEN
jgi:TolA-binding protein